MRKTALIQISLALLLALGAGVVVFKWMDARVQGSRTANAEARTQLVVAARHLARGQRLDETSLRTADFLSATAPSGTFTDSEELLGRVLDADVAEGEPITTARLLSDNPANMGVSTMIAPGKRAVAVKGNKVLGLSGFVRPGNRVDVLVTIDVRKDDKDIPITKTVLEGVRVIATGTELETSGDDGATSPVDIYTLELTSEESERLGLAATRGTLHFALRNPADDAKVATSGVDVKRLLASLGTPKAPGVVHRAPRKVSVEVIAGTTRSTVRFAKP